MVKKVKRVKNTRKEKGGNNKEDAIILITKMAVKINLFLYNTVFILLLY